MRSENIARTHKASRLVRAPQACLRPRDGVPLGSPVPHPSHGFASAVSTFASCGFIFHRHPAPQLPTTTPRRSTVHDGFGVVDGLFPTDAADKMTHLVVFADAGWHYKCGARRKANDAHWDRFTVGEQPHHVVDVPAHKHGFSRRFES